MALALRVGKKGVPSSRWSPIYAWKVGAGSRTFRATEEMTGVYTDRYTLLSRLRRNFGPKIFMAVAQK